MQTCKCGAHEGQKRESDPLELESQWFQGTHRGDWELNLDPLEEQHSALNISPAPRDYCSLFFSLDIFYVHEYFAFMCVFAPHACLVPLEVRRGYLIP